MEDENGTRAIFNQAQFQQIRIHELFTRINRFLTNPLYFNPLYNDYNYNLVYHDLCSALDTIAGKLTDKEAHPEIKEQIEALLVKNPPRETSRDGTWTNISTTQELMNKFSEFRILIERLMEKYGIGNPNKDEEDEY